MSNQEILDEIESALALKYGEATLFSENEEGTSFLVGDKERKLVVISIQEYVG